MTGVQTCALPISAITANRQASKVWVTYGLASEISAGGAGTTVELDASGNKDNLTWDSAGGAWSWTIPFGLADGIYTITFGVTDKAGKSTSLTRTVQLDTTAPEFSLSNLDSGAIVDSDSYTVKGIASDGASGVGLKSISYSLDEGVS